MNTFISAPSDRPPTLREVARAAGVSLASASYALRGHPTVSPATRRKVAETAALLGYRANPLLSAFMQARRVGRSMRADASVALVHGDHALPAAHEAGYFGLCLRGVRSVAAERGYALNAIRWHAARDASATRLARTLDQRGIRGLLLMPGAEVDRWTLPLDWSRFFGVALDHSLEDAPVHRVSDHHAADMIRALARLSSAGHRRPGLVLDPKNNERTREMRLGAYLARARRDFPEAPPPLLVPRGPARPAAVKAWLRANRPDVVLSPEPDVAGVLPPRLPFASLANYTSPAPHPGIRIDAEGVGRTAAFLLFSLLENPGTAAALSPQTILLEGRWQEAGAVPRYPGPPPARRF